MQDLRRVERQLLGMGLLYFVQYKKSLTPSNESWPVSKWSITYEITKSLSKILCQIQYESFWLWFCSNLTAIDMTVDPDGTLDALSNLGLTSPLVTERKISPGAQQGSTVLLPEVDASSTSLSAPRPEGTSTEPCGPLENAEVTERDAGPHVNSNLGLSGDQSSRSYKWQIRGASSEPVMWKHPKARKKRSNTWFYRWAKGR